MSRCMAKGAWNERSLAETEETVIANITSLAQIVAGYKDDVAGGHVNRTAKYSRLLAQKLYEENVYPGRVNAAFIQNVGWASYLHDIGKACVPSEILMKPGPLTEKEFAAVKEHVVIGRRIIECMEWEYPGDPILILGKEIVSYHHEKWDGSGYMKGLRGEEIPLSARIMALSDVYDALRSRRVYKDAFPHEKSARIIAQESGKHFDPLLVDLFLRYENAFREIFDRTATREEKEGTPPETKENAC